VPANANGAGFQITYNLFGPSTALSMPYQIAFDKAGNMYVADPYLYRAAIYKFSPNGDLLGHWGFVSPVGVAVDSAGNIYAADPDIGHSVFQIIELGPDGAPLAHWGGAAGTKPGEFNTESDVAVDRQGNVFFSDIPNNRIYRAGTDGKVSVFKEDSGGPNGLMFGPDGRLYACQNGRKRIVASAPEGADPPQAVSQRAAMASDWRGMGRKKVAERSLAVNRLYMAGREDSLAAAIGTVRRCSQGFGPIAPGNLPGDDHPLQAPTGHRQEDLGAGASGARARRLLGRVPASSSALCGGCAAGISPGGFWLPARDGGG